ncbi:MAG: hypothetical protein COV70_00670 [Parcubacteria group bacterium CG11_big_fil_rev_8_21_14_0_20_39_22]|nr:MAG: hypothetical protein COV70_00670 [Parcubacteria group bacterium CG11_big_fil_rev_8_21_14_0_20_39_22]
MGSRGPKPKCTVDTTWSPDLAYAIGLIASDGCLSNKGNIIDLTSKDREQLENYLMCLRIDKKIGTKKGSGDRCYFRVQFRSVLFYEFLVEIGLFPNKSKILKEVKIPVKYFFDFLRGFFDGDGCVYSYWDRRWKSSFMFYLSFTSASPDFVNWLKEKLKDLVGVNGHLDLSHSKDGAGFQQLKYAKKESMIILKKMYLNKKSISLSRKYLKAKKILAIVGEKI